MRLRAALAAALLLTVQTPLFTAAEGTAFTVRVPSAGLYERPNAAEPVTTLFRDQVVTVLQRRGEWLRIITDEGGEGWMRESTLNPLPSWDEEESQISEASPDDIPVAVLYDFVVGERRGNVRKEPRVSAPVAASVEPGEVLTIVATEGDWYQVSRDGRTEGWIHRTLGTRRESTNLPLRLQDMLEGKLAYFDQFKTETSHFRRQGWFPSFFMRSPRQDIVVSDPGPAGREVTLHLFYARKDIEHRMVIDGADAFVLAGATRTFLSDVILSTFDLSEDIQRVRVRLWFALLEKNGKMTWRSMGELVMKGSEARRMSREGNLAGAVWAGLEENTTPGEIWSSQPAASP